MALNTKMANQAVNVEGTALAAEFNNGYMRLYSGVQPANADDAITTQTLLAELRFGATAFQSVVNGVLTANPITADSGADNTGVATWFRCLKSDGTTKLMDGSVGTSSSNLILNSVNIQAGANVSVTSFVHTIPK
jgi:hypothetical protein